MISAYSEKLIPDFIVTGSHTLGGTHEDDGRFTPFDETPGVFDNLIFKKSLRNECVLPIECSIANDPELRPLIER